MAPWPSVAAEEGAPAGAWGAVTSTIDWCEKNYEVTSYAAEHWNTLSNLVMVVGGVRGLLHCRRHGTEARVCACYLCLLAIGIGSTLFHATLKYEMQLADELPMIFGMAANVYVLRQAGDEANPALICGLAAYCAVVTVVYLISNQPIFHEVMFGLLCAVLTYLNFRHARRFPSALKFVVTGTGLFLLGCLFWLADNRFCDALTRVREESGSPLVGAATQTHALWHLCSGYAGYMQVVLVSFVSRRSLEERAGLPRKDRTRLALTGIEVRRELPAEGEKGDDDGVHLGANGVKRKTRKKNK